jgi:hypothetical protein
MKMLYTLMFFAALFLLFTLAAILGTGLNFIFGTTGLGWTFAMFSLIIWEAFRDVKKDTKVSNIQDAENPEEKLNFFEAKIKLKFPR